MTTVIVLAKAPVPGRVKTRLSPPFTPAQAARLAEAALADTLETVLSTASANPVLALDGEPGAWLPPGLTVIPQITGGLDTRIAAAFAVAAERSTGPALLIGMDTPQITPVLLTPCWGQPMMVASGRSGSANPNPPPSGEQSSACRCHGTTPGQFSSLGCAPPGCGHGCSRRPVTSTPQPTHVPSPPSAPPAAGSRGCFTQPR